MGYLYLFAVKIYPSSEPLIYGNKTPVGRPGSASNVGTSDTLLWLQKINTAIKVGLINDAKRPEFLEVYLVLGVKCYNQLAVSHKTGGILQSNISRIGMQRRNMLLLDKI